MTLLYWFKKCIWPLGIEDLVAIHHGDKIFSVTEVNYVVRIARQHLDSLNMVAIYLPFKDFAFGVVEVALLDESVALNHDKLLKLGIVPVLAFSDARLTDINANLSGVVSVYKLSEGATIIHIHLEREGGLLFGKVTEIRAVEFLGEGAGRNLGNHESLGLFGETLK